VEALLRDFPGWTLQQRAISKTFSFPDYHRTLAFVNAVAWIAHQQDHHPELNFSYNQLPGLLQYPFHRWHFRK